MLFFDAFDGLSVEDQELRKLYADVDVVKIIASEQKGNVYICIKSNRIISYSHLRKMEELLGRKLFVHTGYKAILKPSFELPPQYTLEKLYPLYRDSILEEIKNESIISHHLLSSAKISIDGSGMTIRVTDSCVARERMKLLADFLQAVFMERFNMQINVELEFIQVEEEEAGAADDIDWIRAYAEREQREEFSETGSAIAASAAANQTSMSATGAADINGSVKTNGTVTSGINGSNGAGGRNSSAGGANTAGGKAAVNSGAGAAAGKNGLNGSAGKNGKSAGSGKSTYDKARSSFKKLPADPSVVYGRNFEGNPIPICDITDEIGEVIIRGQLKKPDSRPIGNEKSIITFVLTDYTDSIKVKLYTKTIEVEEILQVLAEGKFFLLKGVAQLDTYERDIVIGSVAGIKVIDDFRTSRKDNAPRKRVELHAHTMMSEMDSVVDIKALIKRAFSWGHSAVAITDHGVVQAFPEANHALNPKDYSDEAEQKRAKEFKIIYGMEAYLVDDIKEVVVGSRKDQSLDDDYVVFDIETTGFSPSNDRIIEIGAVKISGGQIVDKFSSFINPQMPIPLEIIELTGINDDMVIDAPLIADVLPEFLRFCEGCSLVAHNASFDVSFIVKNAERLGIETDFTVIDTVGLSRLLLPELSKYKLNIVAKALNVSLENHHRAVDDAGATAEIFIKLCKMLKEREIYILEEIDRLGKLEP